MNVLHTPNTEASTPQEPHTLQTLKMALMFRVRKDKHRKTQKVCPVPALDDENDFINMDIWIKVQWHIERSKLPYDIYKKNMLNPKFKKPKLLGNGSYGKVYTRDNKVAIKQINLLQDPGGRWNNLQSTVREIHVLLQMESCEWCVTCNRILYVPTNSNKDMFLMLDKANHNLKVEMEKVSLTDDKIFSYSKQLLLGLDALHKKQIFHRDIKPENILVKGEQLLYCDFGLSRQFCDDVEYGTGYIVTRWYRSPELLEMQLEKKKNKEKHLTIAYTAAMDLWSVGAIMYELVFERRHLSAGKDIEDTLKKIKKKLEMLKSMPTKQIYMRCLKGLLQEDERKRSDCTRALFNLGVIDSEALVNHQDKKLNGVLDSSVTYADIQPEKDHYTASEWSTRRNLFHSFFKKFFQLKTVIAYAVVVFDSIDFDSMEKRFAFSVIYSVMVMGTYHIDKTCQKVVHWAQSKYFTDDDMFDYLCTKIPSLRILEVSLWQSKKYTNFNKFLGSVLNNPLKKQKT